MYVILKLLPKGYQYKDAICHKFNLPTSGFTNGYELLIDVDEATLQAMQTGQHNDLYRVKKMEKIIPCQNCVHCDRGQCTLHNIIAFMVVNCKDFKRI